MKAALFLETSAPLVIEEITLDPPGANEVHVKWSASGVCHSDVSLWNGTIPLPPPAILGHEGAGVVVSAGEGVTEFQTGDHVIGCFTPSCGECYFCKKNQPFICQHTLEIGMGRMPFTRSDGSKVFGGVGGLACFSEETVCHEAALVKIPNDFPLDQAALVGCGVTTGVGSALTAAKVEKGSSCAVIGCGGVGLAVIQGCKIAGAKEIIAIDLNPAKRDAAQKFGATHAVDPEGSDGVQAVKDLTEGRGADYAFEVVGHPALQRQAYDMTRAGGVTCWVGVPDVSSEVSLPGAMVALENRTILGTLYGTAVPKTDFVRYVGLAKSGDLDLEGMVSQRIKIDDINEAFRAMLAGEVIRSVVTYD